MSKAELIRQYLSRFPNIGPTELAAKIMSEHKGVKVRPQEVSTLKTQMKGQKPKGPAKMAAKLARLMEAVEAVGGKEEARRILDLLG